MKKKTLVLGCLIIFFLLFDIPSFANSAQAYWEGIDSTGVVTTDEDCPLIVTKEDLTFSISSLLSHPIKIEEYTNHVSAQYTFYNPASYDVTATLVFPFGSQPYYFDFYDSTSENVLEDKYSITADGNILDKTIRYTYGSEYDFNVQRDIKKLKKEYRFDEFWNEQLYIHKCTYKFTGASSTKEFYIQYTPRKEEVIIWGNNSYRIDEKLGLTSYGFWLNQDKTVDVYFVGKVDESFEKSLKFYEDINFKKEVSGELELYKKETSSFNDYAFMFYKEEYGISRIDWYNAILDMLEVENVYNEHSFDLRNRLLCWYEYELVVKSKESVINEVVAPLFPSIDKTYEPTMYTFTYLLSPASTWKDFSNLNIKIVTDAYILNTTLGKLERLEDGSYQLYLDNLPNGEFVFEVCTSLNPKKIVNFYSVIFVIIAILVILLCISPFLIVLLIFYFSGRKHIISAEQKKIKHYYGLEAILSILMIISGISSFFSYYISSIALAGIFFCLCIMVCLIVESIKQKKFMTIRLCLIFIALLSYSLCFIEQNSLHTQFKMVGAISIIFGILLFITEIVNFVKLNKQAINLEQGISQPKKSYPIGYLNLKWKVAFNIFLGVWFMSFVILVTILTFRDKSVLLVSIIYILILVVFVFIHIFSMALCNEKDFIQFVKDLNYETLEKNIFAKLKDSRIHPETKNYYLLKLANVCIAYSLEKYFELQKEIFVPQNKSYRIVYEVSKLNFLLTEKQMQIQAKRLISVYPKNLGLKRNTKNFIAKWKAYFDGEVVESIDHLVPYQTKNEFNNAFHLYIQIYYYKNMNDLQKSNELKQLFFKKYDKLKVLTDELNFGISYREESQKLKEEETYYGTD